MRKKVYKLLKRSITIILMVSLCLMCLTGCGNKPKGYSVNEMLSKYEAITPFQQNQMYYNTDTLEITVQKFTEEMYGENTFSVLKDVFPNSGKELFTNISDQRVMMLSQKTDQSAYLYINSARLFQQEINLYKGIGLAVKPRYQSLNDDSFELAISKSDPTIFFGTEEIVYKGDMECRNEIKISNSKICLVGSKEKYFSNGDDRKTKLKQYFEKRMYEYELFYNSLTKESQKIVDEKGLYKLYQERVITDAYFYVSFMHLNIIDKNS